MLKVIFWAMGNILILADLVLIDLGLVKIRGDSYHTYSIFNYVSIHWFGIPKNLHIRSVLNILSVLTYLFFYTEIDISPLC